MLEMTTEHRKKVLNLECRTRVTTFISINQGLESHNESKAFSALH